GLKRKIEFRKVFFQYNKNNGPVLRDINLEIVKGTMVALVGMSGAGKSTLADLIPRFYDVTSGKVLIDDTDVRKYTVKSLRRNTGIVTQESILFNDSVRYNIAYGRPDCSEKEIVEAARAAYAHDFIMQLPQGYDSIIGERGCRLSGGQRQRIGIARAIAVEPEFIICDESVSALDVSIQADIINLLNDLQAEKNLTYLFISHDLSVVRYISTEVAVMYLGRILEYGSKDNIFNNPLHPYTIALMSAAPEVKVKEKKRILLKGDVPSPINIPSGCPFHPRCYMKRDECPKLDLKLEKRTADHFTACPFNT
ncbi:MAG: ATP-binding cassette domain-containing protein, partial [Candidatus Omnitrophica bacterium]|nr:ATP-binding cassette domain-containing protein [Candidatus Omnitrophota bacterium]